MDVRSVVVFGLAAVGVVAIASFVRDAVLGPPPGAPVPALGFSPHAERDRELRKTHAFLGYVQCPVPASSGIVQIEGPLALEGPLDLVAGFAEFPVFAEAGEVTLRVANHHREVVSWSGLGDGSETPCAPLPVWRPLTPRRVEGHLRRADQTPVEAGHVLACGRFVSVGADGAFAFEGGTERCLVEPFVRRPRSSVAGAPITFDPETSPATLDLVFEPRAVRLDQWQGQAADVEFRLAAEGLVVAHALAPSRAGGEGVVFAAVPGLPQGACITAVAGEPYAGVPLERRIALAEALASAGTGYSVIQR